MVGEHRQGEIGFILYPDHQGHGYATEASRADAAPRVRELGLHRVYAPLEPRNVASRACSEARDAPRGAAARERVGQGRVAERGVYALLARE